MDNRAAFKNPILLEQKLKKYYVNTTNKYVMPLGDLRIWFNTKQEAREAATIDVKNTFGDKCIVVFSKSSMKKLEIYKILHNLTEQDIINNLEIKNIKVKNITFTKRLFTTQDVKTAFITLKCFETKTNILKKGKIRIAFTMFPVAE